MPKPPVPLGPLVSLVYRVAPAKRAEFLAFLRGAFGHYERPGGIRMALYESADEPGLFLEIAAYAGEDDYAADQIRVERDPATLEVLREFKGFIEGKVEVRRFRPLAVDATDAGDTGR